MPNISNKTTEVVKDIKYKIINNILHPGDKLLPLRDLAIEYNTSRSVINSAIHILSTNGYLKVKPRHYVLVNDFLYSGSLEIVRDIYNLSENNLKKKTLEEVMSIRLLVELDAVKKIIDNKRELSELKRVYENEKKCFMLDNYNQNKIIDLDCEFHETLVSISGNSVLFLLYMSFKEIEHDLVKTFYDNRDKVSNIINTHEALIDSLESQNLQEALVIWKALLEKGEEVVINSIK